MKKRKIIIIICIAVALTSSCLSIYLSQHKRLTDIGDIIMEQNEGYDLNIKTDILSLNSKFKLESMKYDSQEVFKYVTFDPNSNRMIGIYKKDQFQPQTIVYLVKENNRLRVEELIYTNNSDDLISSPKSVPDSEKISFRQNNCYYIYDPTKNTTEKLDLLNAHNVVWLDSDTVIYTSIRFPRIERVEIRKYCVSTKEDQLYIEGGYGSSLSYNRRFLAYGMSDDPTAILIRDLQTDEIKSFPVAPATYLDSSKYTAFTNKFNDYQYVNIGDARGLLASDFPILAVLLGDEDIYDGCFFQPSSDGTALLYASEKENLKCYYFEENSPRNISKFKPTSFSWKT